MHYSGSKTLSVLLGGWPQLFHLLRLTVPAKEPEALFPCAQPVAVEDLQMNPQMSWNLPLSFLTMQGPCKRNIIFIGVC